MKNEVEFLQFQTSGCTGITYSAPTYIIYNVPDTRTPTTHGVLAWINFLFKLFSNREEIVKVLKNIWAVIDQVFKE